MALRFRKRKLGGVNRILVLSAGKTTWRASIATYDAMGVPTFSEPVTSPPSTSMDDMTEWLANFASANQLKYVAIGIGHGFVVTASSGVTRYGDVETQRLLRNEPAKLFGETSAQDSGQINALVNHPHAENSCLRFKIQAEEIAKVRDICADAGLAVARVVCEQAQLLELAYAGEFKEDDSTRAVMITLPSSFLFIPLDGSGWHSVTFDPVLDDQAVSALLGAASEALSSGSTLAYIDAGMPGIEDVIAHLVNNHPKALYPSASLSSFAAITLN